MAENFDKSLLDDHVQSGPIPAPPQKEVEVRTMESDLQAFKESGGEVPLSGEKQSFVSQSKEQPVNTIMNPYAAVSQKNNQASAQSTVPVAPVTASKSGNFKSVLIILIVIFIIAAMGYLGYAYVFPLIFR